MKKLLSTLASLKLAVILLVLLLLGLAAGTIVESSSGVAVAGRQVYYAWWFIALQAAFAANVLASIVAFFPWGRSRIGFLTAHGALLVILAGAVTSWFFKVEGQLQLWKGESGDAIASPDSGRVALPFTVKLDDFRVDHYPGTMRPSNFRSDVEVIEPSGARFKTAIWMNHELEHQGWRFFQSSYRQEDGRVATVLSVSKDPGQPIVFLGYGLLVAGMCIVLGTRISQTRARREREAAAAKESGIGKAAALGALALAFALPAHAADPALEALRRLPVQHDGRVMPLDTLAREAVWTVTGQRSWDGADPVSTATSWAFDPPVASSAPVVALGSSEIAAAAGLPAGASHGSFLQIVNSRPVLQLMDQAHRAAEANVPRQGALAAAEKLEARLVLFQQFLQREILRPLPPAGDVNGRWSPVPAPLLDARNLAALATGARPAGWPEASGIEREVTYNAVRPTRIAWIVLAAALAVSILAWNRRSKVLDGLAAAGLAGGFAVMSWGIAMRWQIAGRIPASNMYESLLFLAWGVGLFAMIAFAVMRNRLVVVNANAMAALTMALTDLLPIDRFIHPVPPVLSGTPWLAIHVPIIMVSYSVLALGVVVAHMQIGFTIFAPRRAEIVQRMNDLLYWYMHVGSILLVTGIMTGSIWAASSWGRYWGWDPKEVWSLVAFLAYVAIIHGRWDRIIGPFGVAAISIVAFQTILMTYLGVNYVLTTGLHSYGMGDSPVVTWMVIVAAVEIAFLAVGLVAERRQQRREAAALAAA